MSIKGLSTLAELMDDLPKAGAQEIALSLIDPDPHQPRTSFDALRMEALAESVRAQGVIEPLIVSAHPEQPGRYMLVAGERRWRAAGMAGLTRVPAVLRELTPDQRLAVQLVENIDREELSVLEESRAVVRLIDFGRKPKDVAGMLGKTQAWVSLRRKIADNQDLLEVFVSEGLTRDAETLTMLVDLRKLDSAAFDAMQRSERVTRGAVRDALELVKRRMDAPVKAPDGQPSGTSSEPAEHPVAHPDAILDPVSEPKATPPVSASAEGNDLAERLETVRRAVQTRLGFPVSIHAQNPDGSGELRIGFANLQELDLLRKTLT